MLELETCLQQKIKIALPQVSINDLAAGLPELSRQLGRTVAATLLEQLQAQRFESVMGGAAEIVCTRCGVVHSGPSGNLLRRGSRARRVMTSSGPLDFRLHQVTCGDCRRTWSPFAEWLGLAERQRICEELERKLVECVTELSYRKTCTLGEAWLGASVSPRRLHAAVQKRGAEVKFTPAPECAVVQADGTKVPAGKNPRGCDAWFSLQILGREKVNGRTQVQKRIAGWGIGSRAWEMALPSGIASELILTDREKGLPELLQRVHPNVRHGLCEWHVPRALNQRLHFDGVKVKDRKALVGKLSKILSGPLEKRREKYIEFTRSLGSQCRRARAMLDSSAPHVLYDTPQPERTTSVIEREMREINRRADVGVRWTIKGIDHLLRLRHSKRINPDDFERVWSEVQTPSFTVVPLA